MKMCINQLKSKTDTIDFKECTQWKNDPPKRLDAKTIRAFIFQCRNIPAADDSGTSDCFITVWNPDGILHKTKVIEETLNPIYMETIQF